MDNNVFDDTLQGLQEALAYAKGETALRTFTVTVDDAEIERNHIFIQNFYKLPEPSKIKAIEFVRELAMQV
ncbi:MAG: hypothetical protein FWC16_04845 [Defluviitaleaceae bacterium]|nr:hypothetical protein [Defluviitaleaceae bacterium]MCL2274235.1 hypothetical protein [Defluviitaleaceae bacterium]